MRAAIVWLWLFLPGHTTPQADVLAYPYAYSQAECSPTDGPAIGIYLTTSNRACGKMNEPYLKISIYEFTSQIAGKTFQLDRRGTGSAVRCGKPLACELAESGQVTIRRVGKEGKLYGNYELHFKNGATEKGTFKTKWCDAQPLCP